MIHCGSQWREQPKEGEGEEYVVSVVSVDKWFFSKYVQEI